MQEYLDFVIYNPEMNQNKLFSEYLKENLFKEITLTVYNLAEQETRLVKITPTIQKDSASLIGAEYKF